MHKKLLAVAVAGALALPGAALAASSVTITGFFKMSYAWIKVKPQAAGGEDNEDRVQDESSRIIFRIVEDLGGGLQAIGQVDWRVPLDNNNTSDTSGANWVGVRSKSWGELTIGRHDLHYVYTEDQSYSRGGSLKMTNHGIIAFGNGGGSSIANASRTPNVIRWFSPNWNGFTAVVAYSTNPLGASENDIGSTQSDGRGWNVAPQYNAKNWGIGYSYWNAKADATTTPSAVAVANCTAVGVPVGVPACAAVGQLTLVTTAGTTAQVKQRGDRVNGHYQWGGLRIGVVWDKAKYTNEISGGETGDRDAWSIPIRYDWGKHSVFGHYSWAKDDDVQGDETGAKMFAIGYGYSLSKRTKLSLNYAKIKNDDNARYNLFTSAAGSLGSGDAAVANGQDPSQIAVTITHNF